ncbi:transglutaminase family protein [Aeoliella mucimassa]|uniref:Protein-glutamine gamma-glutamyltransferase n=1 Tax=Aeoliella mucimassa TaxID=2527972 RepID=A0A518ARE3_9BACT|nr:transglutaminase family protein [Aeoliella mucimassa]QDU57294.1 Protein-glutamine gamma-glutamyltransferase [Aeoliella mucimassa]
MKYRITHTTKYSYSEPVPVCQNKLHLLPRTTAWQTCENYRLMVLPEPAMVDIMVDYFGNAVDYFSLIDSHQHLSVTAASDVEVTAPDKVADPAKSKPWEEVASMLRNPASVMPAVNRLFAYDSDYCRAEKVLADYARQSFTPQRPIVEACIDLTKRIYDDFEYRPQSTTVNTEVAEVFEKRQGVCQDFAHLQIACLRSLGLAARYVSGYLRTIPPPGKPRLVGADASHAWLAVYCSGDEPWIDFDPTNNVIPETDHITVAYGRDYGDVCPVQGVFVGGGNHTLNVSVDVAPVG